MSNALIAILPGVYLAFIGICFVCGLFFIEMDKWWADIIGAVLIVVAFALGFVVPRIM